MTALDDIWDGGAAPVVATEAAPTAAPVPTTALDAIWDAPSTSVAQTEIAPSVFDNILSDIKDTPKDLWSTIKQIPGGVSNLIHLPGDALAVGGDELGLIKDAALGTITKPVSGDTYQESQGVYDRLQRTISGLGSLGANVAGFALAGPTGASAANVGFEKLKQITGSAPETTPEQDLASFRKGAVQGTVLNMASAGLGAAANKVGEVIKPASPEMQQVQSLGIKLSDLKKAEKHKPTIDGETPMQQAVAGATERGVFTGDSSPIAIAKRNENAIAKLGDELHGENGVLKQVDVITPNAEAPTFPRAEAVIKEYFKNSKALKIQLKDRLEAIAESWDGTVSDLGRIKTGFGKDAFSGLTDSKVLDQAITRDLKDFIQKKAEAASPELGAAVKDLNAKLSEHYTLETPIENARLKAQQAEFKPSKGNPISNALKSGASIVGKGSLAGAAAGIAGAPLSVSLPIAATVVGLKGVASALENPTIAGMVSKGLSKVNGGLAIPAIISAANKPKERAMDSIISGPKAEVKKEEVKAVEQQIDAHPYYKALYEAESGRNPEAKNPNSSAKGGFQFINATAKALGLDNPFDLAASFDAVKKLTEQNAKIVGSTDPTVLYGAHYLGAPLMKKLVNKEPLNSKEHELAMSFVNEALPNFLKRLQVTTA